MTVIARAEVPQLDPCFVNTVIDPVKYPLAFRNAPSNHQVGNAAAKYMTDVLKAKAVALVGDTTGYGTSAIAEYAPILKAKGGTIAFSGVIDGNSPDLTADLMKLRALGVDAISPWSVNAGFLSRLLNARGRMGWDVPVAGQPTLGSGQTKALLEKPEYWEKVYQVGFRSASYDANGKLPPRSQDFVARLKTAKVDMTDTLLWWITCGYDVPYIVAAAYKAGAGTPQEIAAHWSTFKAFPGVFGEYTFTKDDHNGFATDNVIMSQANSFREGCFDLAPGYT